MDRNLIIEKLLKYFEERNILRCLILTDSNVENLYPDFFCGLQSAIKTDKIVISAGEQSKSIENTIRIWQFMATNGYDKNSFILNFGGGMVSDLGGFVASTYKRGIPYANCPTTLLSMIDASIGGKTAIDFLNIKNCVGTFHFPSILLPLYPEFLNTLPRDEFMSGMGELVKYSLIIKGNLFEELSQLQEFSPSTLKSEWLSTCTDFKNDIVHKDPYDKGIRHILNFGHTVGHAIESSLAESGSPVAHGLAVAQGLFFECYLSHIYSSLDKDQWHTISSFLKKHFQIIKLDERVLQKLVFFMSNDKKNESDFINFTFLKRIGEPEPNRKLPEKDVINALNQLKNDNYQ